MKRKTKLLLALSGIPLSCNNATKNNNFVEPALVGNVTLYLNDPGIGIDYSKEFNNNDVSKEWNELICEINHGNNDGILNLLNCKCYISILNEKDKNGKTLLMYLVSSKDYIDSLVLSRFLENKADVTTKDKDGKNVLMHLLDKYHEINYFSTYYNPKTRQKCQRSDVGRDRHPGVNRSKAKENAYNPTIQAIRRNKKEILKLLCKERVIKQIINSEDKNGTTILEYLQKLLSMIPEKDEKKEIINMLLDAGLDDKDDELAPYFKEDDMLLDAGLDDKDDELAPCFKKGKKFRSIWGITRKIFQKTR